MLCSAEELGLPRENDGLLELPSDLKLGHDHVRVPGKKVRYYF